MESTNYDKLSQKQHIYQVSDSYVGSDAIVPRETYIMNTPQSIVLATITLPVAIERLFIEVLSNASDNVDRSRRRNLDPGDIDIQMNNKRIRIVNGGITIPIEIHPTYNIYTPELIFGNLLTSSNYKKDVDRTGAGRNGFGAKLVNIFSKEFVVRIGDRNRGLEYTQVWTNNMDNKHDPIITRYSGNSYVCIEYELDFQRFNYTCYPDEAFQLFARLAADTSLTMKTPVRFNGLTFNFNNPCDYAKLLFPEVKNYLLHKQEGIEVVLIDTIDKPIVISSVNGMMTPDGGVHVDAVYKAIQTSVIPIINKDEEAKITLTDIKNNISLIIICHLPNPKFNSQSKTKLSAPTPKLTLDPNQVKKMLKWDLITHLNSLLDFKKSKILNKTDGKKTRYVDIDKAEDANYAGTSKSHQCILLIVEGKSAKGYANCLQTLVQNGRNTIGIYPMKGKPLNVMNASYKQISENQEYKELKQMLGLKEDVNYLDDANFNSLRYGSVMILTDADDDGKHIAGLIINIFYCRFPTLLRRYFLTMLRTPIIRVSRRNEKLSFYSYGSYEQWRESVLDYASWKHKYYKGLATSTKEDVKEDFMSSRTVCFLYDDTVDEAINLAFNEKLADERKKWLESYIPVNNIEEYTTLNISDFINYEFIRFSLSDLARSIPRLIDGLKVSQRKAIWAAIINWKRKELTEDNDFKVIRFANYVAERTSYHHGEDCMCSTIISMAQDFVGANNLPYFTQGGQFGTRNDGGKDAGSSRYIFTRPEWWIPYVFMAEDDDLLTKVIDEGQEQEPITFYPIIPLALINGTMGIGTGYSTFIPNHSVLDVIQWLKCKLNKQQTPTLLPWYKGFTGTIEIKQRKRIDVDHEVYSIKGVYEQLNNDEVLVTEIPINRTIHSYKNWLDSLRRDKVIKEYANYSTTVPKFLIKGMKEISHKSLKLVSKIGTSNMVLLDENNKPKRYSNVDDILNEFTKIRLDMYVKRKELLTKKLYNELITITNKQKLIYNIVNGVIKVFGRKMNEIEQDLHNHNIPKETFKNISLTSCTHEKLIELDTQVKEINNKYNTLCNKTPQEMWLEDLHNFEVEYRKHYKE